METLLNKTAVVLGGTGGVGEGIVKALLEAGATVVVPTRYAYKGDRLKSYLGETLAQKLVLYNGSVNTETGAQELAAFLMKNVKNIDVAVVSIGARHEEYPLYSFPVQDWDRMLQTNLTAHFFALRTLIPLMNPQDSFFMHINSHSADESFPMTGPMAMMAAAQKSMIQTLANEVNKTGIKVHELILGPVNTRERVKRGQGAAENYTSEEIGAAIRGMLRLTHRQEVVQYFLRKEPFSE